MYAEEYASQFGRLAVSRYTLTGIGGDDEQLGIRTLFPPPPFAGHDSPATVRGMQLFGQEDA